MELMVYDVTKFLDDHPGGDDVLLSATGSLSSIFWKNLLIRGGIKKWPNVIEDQGKEAWSCASKWPMPLANHLVNPKNLNSMNQGIGNQIPSMIPRRRVVKRRGLLKVFVESLVSTLSNWYLSVPVNILSKSKYNSTREITGA
ncbi:hypothetical protein RJ640_011259 [Escallonia rubra]|uniref:Cytochrome b5 heme-binding domain-containing protein n=1 Tax=Escallonia rubra TaxID=112253 RepID=A0AA88RRS9_9ASTE|nr:hypothetical protein RJ640_011259 [Escallonia rubra]